MKRLRVFHLTTSGSVIAGAEQLLVGTARLADRARWDLAFCSLTPRDKMHEALAVYGWPVHALGLHGAASLPGTLRRLRAVVADFRPDVLHAHLSLSAILAATVGMVDRSFALVQTRHYSEYVARFRKRRLVVEAWAARRCDRIIAVSDAARAQLVEGEGVDGGRVTVVDNGVEWDRLSALDHEEGRRALEALGVPPGRTIGCAATFNVCKGHTYLLQAMVRVVARHPDVRLVLLGGGEGEAATRSEAARLGLEDRVHFLGHRADVHALIAGLDIYAQPSVEEGFGLALIEAMAMSRPVVATAVGGMLRTIDPDRTGVQVPPADAVRLADALLALIEDPARGAKLGRNASEHVRQHYSLQQMLDQYDDIYRRALAERS